MSHYLYHYYECDRGPFKNLSGLSDESAAIVMGQLQRRGDTFASKRGENYLAIRKDLEAKARDAFIAKGGRPSKSFPHYFTLGQCTWIRDWYRRGCEISIDLEEFDPGIVSFTYGDLFPTMRVKDEKPYREKVYLKAEILELIKEYGLPQDWNADGTRGPEQYIEAQVWDDRVIGRYIL